MGVQVAWLNEKQTVIEFKIEGEWTWTEMYQHIDECYTMMDTVQHTVATVFEISKAQGLPPNALSNMRQLNRRRHPNSGKVVVIGLTPLYRIIMNTFQRLYTFSNPNGVYFVATSEESLKLLDSYLEAA